MSKITKPYPFDNKYVVNFRCSSKGYHITMKNVLFDKFLPINIKIIKIVKILIQIIIPN
jgi:hypothetical protein